MRKKKLESLAEAGKLISAENDKLKKDNNKKAFEIERARANEVHFQTRLDAINVDLKTARSIISALKGDLSRNSAALGDARRKIDKLATRVRVLTTLADSQRAYVASLKKKLSWLNEKLNDRPPIIIISDAEVHTFKSASAEMSPALRAKLRRTAPELKRYGDRYGAKVIEIIGHTDDVEIGKSFRERCNLDASLLGALNRTTGSVELIGCDNVGLGMARAVSVVMELKALGLDDQFQIIPLSAGQAVMLGDRVAKRAVGEDEKRRRIEIRLRRARE